MSNSGGIFLSYAHDEEHEVEDIAAKLRASGCMVFFDKKSMKGDRFDERIKAEVERCELFVFFASPAALRSKSYALTELEYAEVRWANPTGHVLAFRVGATRMEDVPAYLRAVINIQSIEGNFATGAFNRIEGSISRPLA